MRERRERERKKKIPLTYRFTYDLLVTSSGVDDQATALLMERFYTHLRADMGKGEALRQAQIDTLAEHAHPYYWIRLSR